MFMETFYISDEDQSTNLSRYLSYLMWLIFVQTYSLLNCTIFIIELSYDSDKIKNNQEPFAHCLMNLFILVSTFCLFLIQ